MSHFDPPENIGKPKISNLPTCTRSCAYQGEGEMFGFLMFPWGSKGNIEKKKVNIRTENL